jgi:hypothetical protein
MARARASRNVAGPGRARCGAPRVEPRALWCGCLRGARRGRRSPLPDPERDRASRPLAAAAASGGRPGQAALVG